MISAILLAAGDSTRMGRPKQIIELDGEPMAQKSLRALLDSPVDEIVVVLGNLHASIRERLSVDAVVPGKTKQGGIPVRSVVNERCCEGMGSSIKKGIEALSPGSEAAVIALADQPFIRPDTITALIEAFKASGLGIAIPRFRDRRGHPVIFGAKYYEALRLLPPDRGANTIVRGSAGDVLSFDVEDEGILIDIDTPDDLARHASSIQGS